MTTELWWKSVTLLIIIIIILVVFKVGHIWHIPSRRECSEVILVFPDLGFYISVAEYLDTTEIKIIFYLLILVFVIFSLRS